ncbi:MAG: thioredoxin family protein [Candidatus Bathyarchaeia archaeon]
MSSTLKIGGVAPDFDLPAVDGQRYSLSSFRDKKVVVVMFTCNHCPYVQAYESRLIAIQRDYAKAGVALAAINSNDDVAFPEDNFENMVTRAKAKGYNFPYLHDEAQTVAQAYGATVTPEIFVLDSQRRLRYHGRVDDNWKEPGKVKSPDLREALDALVKGQPAPKPETQAFGCTVKWK